MPNNWHPKLPASAKARRMLYAENHYLVLDGDGELIRLDDATQNCEETRFIIGTVAARLCEQLAITYLSARRRSKATGQCNYDVYNQWCAIVAQWHKWAEGEDWQ